MADSTAFGSLTRHSTHSRNIVAIAALLATISVGRWAFRPQGAEGDVRKALEDERRAVEELTTEVESLGAKPPPA